MRADRLLQIAQDVRNAAPERFSMSTWFCGTSACAIGHHIIAHRDCGMRLSNGTVFFGGQQGYEAVAIYCEIAEDDAEDLFMPRDWSFNRSPESVATRIEQYVAANSTAQVIEMKPEPQRGRARTSPVNTVSAPAPVQS
jgi:hypothetical protein